MMSTRHIQEELLEWPVRIVVDTKYGPVKGGRSAATNAAAFLEVPYALPPARFTDPEPLPENHRYEDKEYVYESAYCVQPNNDGQASGTPYEHKVGLGKPSENPLFLNIVCPPYPIGSKLYPVKVYIHGGFLQFGSPHSLSSQAQWVSVQRSEVWVNIGYRVSAFGFLASDEPKIDGNFGFKDQWLALLWIKDNIKSFGGDPDDIQVTGLSAGAHSVHQILQHASHLPEGQDAPFHSAMLQSNSIVIAPKTHAQLRPQYQALCRALKLDPSAPDTLSRLRDPKAVPWSDITHVIETDAAGIQYGTFRGCLDGIWLPTAPDPMVWQRSGSFARALKAKGVRSIVVGDLTQEWYLYSIAHPVSSMKDIELNLERYYQEEMVKKVIGMYEEVPEGAPEEDYRKLFGEILSEGQVHLPVRLLARDLFNAGFPVLRYEIQWTPEQHRPFGYVTHGGDRVLWALRIPSLEVDQRKVAYAWLDTIRQETAELEKEGTSKRSMTEVLALKDDKTIGWVADKRWDRILKLRRCLPGEE